MEQHLLRRIPKQQRGNRRVEMILDAAEQIFLEVGCDAATTNAIAAQAHMSIGSLYQFFPNKEAIVRGLAEQYAQQLRVLYNQVFQREHAVLPLSELLDKVIDSLVEFDLAHKAFKALFAGTQASLALTAAIEALDQELIWRIETLFEMRLPNMDHAARRRYATVCLHIVRALLACPTSPETLTQDELIHELKTVLFTYITPLLGDEQQC